jgi:hypothetical protein
MFSEWPNYQGVGFYSPLLTAMQNFHNNNTEEASSTHLMGQAFTIKTIYDGQKRPPVLRWGTDRTTMAKETKDFLESIILIISKISEFDFSIKMPVGREAIAEYFRVALRKDKKTAVRVLLSIALSGDHVFRGCLELLDWWEKLGDKVIGTFDDPKDPMDFSDAPGWVQPNLVTDKKGRDELNPLVWRASFPWSKARDAFLTAAHPDCDTEVVAEWLLSIRTTSEPPGSWINEFNLVLATKVNYRYMKLHKHFITYLVSSLFVIDFKEAYL